GARHVHPVIVARRKIDGGEIAADERRRALGLAAQQVGQTVRVPLGLENAAVLNGAELADGAVDRADYAARFGIQGAGAGPELAGEELVESFVGQRILQLGFAHVYAVSAHEARDHPVLDGGRAAICGMAHQARHQVMGRQILAGKKKLVFEKHGIRLKVLPRRGLGMLLGIATWRQLDSFRRAAESLSWCRRGCAARVPAVSGARQSRYGGLRRCEAAPTARSPCPGSIASCLAAAAWRLRGGPGGSWCR